MAFEAYQLSIINQNWGDEPDDFFVQAHCEVREKGSAGGEAFELNIVSPKRIKRTSIYLTLLPHPPKIQNHDTSS